MKILIDNGHGVNTKGKRSPDGRLLEYRYCREIAAEVEKRLRAQGYDAERIVTEEADISLGRRERGIIAAVAKGWSNKEIADRLCISVHTVATHRRNICAKLAIHSSAGLTVYAILNGLVDLKDIDL